MEFPMNIEIFSDFPETQLLCSIEVLRSIIRLLEFPYRQMLALFIFILNGPLLLLPFVVLCASNSVKTKSKKLASTKDTVKVVTEVPKEDKPVQPVPAATQATLASVAEEKAKPAAVTDSFDALQPNVMWCARYKEDKASTELAKDKNPEYATFNCLDKEDYEGLQNEVKG